MNKLVLFLTVIAFHLSFTGRLLGINISYSNLFIFVIIIGVINGIRNNYFSENSNLFLTNKYNNLIFLFIIFSVFSLLWTPAFNYGSYKLALFSLKFLMIFVNIPLIIKESRFFIVSNIAIFTTSIMLLLLIFGFNIFNITSFNRWDRFGGNDYQSNSINVGRYFGLASIFYYLIILYKNSTYLKLASVFLIVISILLIVITGSKGPLISTLLVMILITLPLIKKLGKAIIVFLVIFFGLWIGTSSFVMTTLSSNDFIFHRYIDFSGSSNSRYLAINKCLDNYLESPLITKIFGEGIGATGYVLQSSDVPDYPHNIFVEILVEFGLVGLLSIIYLIVITLIFINKKNAILNKSDFLFYFGGLVFSLINSMFSGDYATNYYLFDFFILSTFYLRTTEITKNKCIENSSFIILKY